METIQVISTTTVKARNHVNGDSPKLIDLNAWDLPCLLVEHAQKGLLFHKPTLSSSSSKHTDTSIQHLKDSLSLTLDFFPLLAGRLAIVHDDDGTSSVFIACNNAGVSFIHAIAENTTIADILEPTYVPPVVHSFFPPNKSKNFEGTRLPLMVIQVTQLVDGIFIACSKNHCLADVKPGWNFWNTWAEISRNLLNHVEPNSMLASFERWFPHGNIQRPIRIPLREIIDNYLKEFSIPIEPPPYSRRIFHFKKEQIAELKAKASSELVGSVFSNKISSLQAVLGHIWRSVVRNQHFDPEEEVTYRFYIAARFRISDPPIPDNYFGITVLNASVTMKARDLVGDAGHGKFASEMNKVVSSFTEEKIKRDFEVWVQNPIITSPPVNRTGKVMKTSSSPKVNFYAIDFGWGRPLGLRLGPTNINTWKLAADAGAEEGSLDIEVCIPHEILEALGSDTEFMHMVSTPPSYISPSSIK